MFKTRTEKEITFTPLDRNIIRKLGFQEMTNIKWRGTILNKGGRTNRKLWIFKTNNGWRIFEGYDIAEKSGNLEEILEGQVSKEELIKTMKRLMSD